MFSPEMRDILLAVRHDDICTSVLNFLDQLLVWVKNIFVNCKEADEIQPKLGTYNPAKYGRAYYFTEHGNQIWNIPKYTIDDSSANSTYDDDDDEPANSTYDDEPANSTYDNEPARVVEKCHKKFPEVGRKGTTYLYLWFDPQHYGHWYGFHMIPSSEGRKDPSCSLYSYMKVPPEEVFYDFSCQLEGYFLKREPGFWKKH